MTKSTTKGGSKTDPWKLKTPPGTAEFEAYLRKDIDKWAQVVKSAGIKPE